MAISRSSMVLLLAGLTGLLGSAPLLRAQGEAQDEDAQAEAQRAKDQLVVEAIQRLENYDLSTAPDRVKAAVSRHLASHAGSDLFFDLIERFKMRDQSGALLTLALAEGEEDQGVRAVALLLTLDEKASLQRALANSDSEAGGRLLGRLSASGREDGLAIVLSLLSGRDVPLATRRAAVGALARSNGGQRELLAIVAAGKLPADLEVAAGSALLFSSDQSIRTEAAKHLKMPAAAGNQALAPVAELVKASGDLGKGKEVFQRACVACHQAGNSGINFGPALGEIGDKLSKEALYVSILEPSAGISFGFEGYVIDLKEGGPLAGYIASETDDELVVRAPGGIDLKAEKSNIVRRTKMETSLMPPGLQAAMTQEDLVNLVEYLASLKKAR